VHRPYRGIFPWSGMEYMGYGVSWKEDLLFM